MQSTETSRLRSEASLAAIIVIILIILAPIIAFSGFRLIIAAYTSARTADIERRKILALHDIHQEGEAARDTLRRANWDDTGW